MKQMVPVQMDVLRSNKELQFWVKKSFEALSQIELLLVGHRQGYITKERLERLTELGLEKFRYAQKQIVWIIEEIIKGEA